ncbi:hypothetical protein AX16_006945 [Volvariella volvacea WC 439]|nr:hypothetical protein AX16_006945 [Volvariella volvacea WC 439]
MLNVASRSLLKAASARSILASNTQRVSTLQNPLRTIVTLKDHKYTAHATASGAGRNGTVVSEGVEVKLSMPKELGGRGDGQNPEQLFAMGYSACLLGAIQLKARQTGKEAMGKQAKVHASVAIGEANELGGLAIAVDLKVEGVDEEVLKLAHEACPYSRALTHGVEVKVSLA